MLLNIKQSYFSKLPGIFHHFLMLGCLLSMLFFLAACGGGSSSDKNTALSGAEQENASTQNFSGLAQKGPFVADSRVVIRQLDEKGRSTGKVINGKLVGLDGAYRYHVPADWSRTDLDLPVEVSISGVFIDEANAHLSDHPVTLNALLAKPGNTPVNLLTHFVALRTKVLLLDSNKTVVDALRQAQSELQSITGIAAVANINILKGDKTGDSAQLLLLSGALQEVSKTYKTSEQYIINQMSADFAVEGVLNVKGKAWLKRIQEAVRSRPQAANDRFAKNLYTRIAPGLRLEPAVSALPETVALASRPQAIAPEVIFAKPGETVTLDGSASHDSGGALINYTWFRIDQQTQYSAPISDRFIPAPTIVAPNEESELLFALIVTDEEKLTDTTVVKVIVKNPPPVEPPPVEPPPVEPPPVEPPPVEPPPVEPPPVEPPPVEPPPVEPPPVEPPPVEPPPVEPPPVTPPPPPPPPVNFRPAANPASVVTDEDTPIDITLTGSDPEGDSLRFFVGFMPLLLQHGILEGAPPNVRYIPSKDFSGSDSFTFFVADSFFNISNIATVNITINPVNDKPQADPKNVTTNENQFIGVNLSGSDVENDSLTFSISSAATHGSLDVSSLPTVVYTPEDNYNGPDSFSYRAHDGQLFSDPARVDITILPVNGKPMAQPQSIEMNQDTSRTIVLTGIDSDGDALSYKIVDQPTHGSLSGVAPNISYTPDADYVGDDSFSFLVNDGVLDSDIATVQIKVLPVVVNNQPDADSKFITTPFETPAPIILTGSDADGDNLTFNIASLPSHGSLSGSPPNIIYQPELTYSGLDSFLYTAFDGKDVSDVALVSITVEPPINKPPTANAGPDQSVTSGDTVTLNGSGSDPEDGATSVFEWTAPNDISLSDATVANPTFTAPAVTSPTTFTLSLVVRDSQNLASAPDSVAITVNPPVNQPPTANAGTDQSVTSGDTVTLNGSGSDPEDGATTVFEWTAPNDITLSDVTVANPTFTAPAVNSPTTFTLSLVVRDSQNLASAPDSVAITVNPANQAPTANSFSLDVNQDESVKVPQGSAPGNMGGTDPDGDALMITDRTDPSHGVVSVTQQNTDFIYTYTPTPGYCGTDSFDYKVDDGSLKSEFATVTFNVNCKPIANAGLDKTVSAGSNVTLDGTASNDAEDGSSITYLWTPPANIMLTDPTSSTPSFIAPNLSTPSPAITLVFELVVTDTKNLSSEKDFVTITVEAASCLAPLANAGVDREVISLTTVTLYGSGVPRCGDDNGISDYFWEQVDIVPGTEVTLDFPDPYNHSRPTFTAPDVTTETSLTFQLKVDDFVTSSPTSEPDLVVITVFPKGTVLNNERPTADDKPFIMDADGSAVSIELTGNDPDGDDIALTYRIVSPPTNGSFTLDYDSDGVGYGTYRPNYPVKADSFTYVAIDQNGAESIPATISLTPITSPPGNQAPVVKGADITISPVDSSNWRFDLYLERDGYVVDPESDPVQIREVARTENGTRFSILNFGDGWVIRAENRIRTTPSDGQFQFFAVDRYGNESAPVVFNIEWKN